MGCDACREVLSAGLDGESTPQERAEADAHVAGCGPCRQWLDDAAAVTRMARARPVTDGGEVAGVDVTGAALAAAPGRGRARLALVLRALLLVLGLAQLVLAASQVGTLSTDGHVHDVAARGGAAPGHLWHESAAWNAAVGAAFLWVGARRRHPAGIVTMLSVFVGALLLLSTGDVVAGRVAASRLVSHAFVVAGYVLVLALAVPRLGLGGTPGSGVATPGPRPSGSAADTDSAAAEPAETAEAGPVPPAPYAPVVPLPHRVRAAWRTGWRDAA